MDQELAKTIEGMESDEIPILAEWEPKDESEIFMEFKGDYAQAYYDRLGLNPDNKLSIFVIKKNHYKDRMDDICKVINYFLTYYDKDLELFKSTMSIKFIIDQRPNMSIKAFQKMVLTEMVTDAFVVRIKDMARHLYTINIDSDTEGRYKSTPKISNDQARLIVSISFAIRCILPLCIHFSDTNNNFASKKDYIPCFDKIIMKIIKKFEKDDIEVFTAIEKFVKYRVDRSWKADIGICLKKKQLYGMTQELYLEEVIHEVILVKSLYKLDYDRSVVSFIDGIIFLYHYNFKIENFKFKPIEIDQQENQDDDSERLSHAEAIEMAVYRIDESQAFINDANTHEVLKDIRKRFNIDISEEEIDFYYDNMTITPVTKLFLEAFYARIFHDSNAILNVDRRMTIVLIIIMKKYLQYMGMIIIPQLCTAKVRGKYKENTIKNSKFIEKIETSDQWNNIIQKKFTYVEELNQKDNILLKKFSTFINSQFEFVDYNGPDDGLIYEDVDQDRIIYEFSTFLSII
jgi:hypothetical protein